jgi:hypothetical protein
MGDTYQQLAVNLHNAAQDVPDNADAGLMRQASAAIDALTAPGLNDFANFQHAGTRTREARANWEAASARLELAQLRERMAELLSQGQPLADLDLDREKVRQVLHFVACGRLK